MVISFFISPKTPFPYGKLLFSEKIKMPKKLALFIIFALLLSFASSCTQEEKRILVFSKTAEFRHGSIEAGQTALLKMGLENNLKIDTTEDASFFTEEILKQYSAAVSYTHLTLPTNREV